MIDRKTAPPFNILKNISLPEVKHFGLSNGRDVFYLQSDQAEVFKMELVIKAGSWYAEDYHPVPLTLKMLNEGTVDKSGLEMANAFDSIGSFTEFTPGFDHCSLGLYGLSKYFSANIQLLSELIFTPAFEARSFSALKSREVQRQKLNLEKSSYKASVNHRSNIFGPNHPYGVSTDPEETEKVLLSQCFSFYQNRFSDFDIMVSGNLPDDFKGILDKYFGSAPFQSSQEANSWPYKAPHTPQKESIERNTKFVQSTIRIGKRLFNRSHPDYMTFMLLNEVLGGYFGSRLMSNIREDKGYTYGIYSQLYSLNHDGYFSIGTDVDTENENQTVEEIYKEIKALQDTPIPLEELNTVKNYMTGTFAGSVNSPFSIMNKFKATYYQGLDLSFYDRYIHTINSATSDELVRLAHDYLSRDSFCIAIVGR